VTSTEVRDPVAQMFMLDFSGHEPSADIERFIADDGIGGVILFVKNIALPRQTAALTNRLQKIASEAGRPPLLISADQEGGRVVRLRDGATHFPSAMAFGAAGSEALVASAAGITARELRAVGIQMNLAPVLDVNNNPANPVIGLRAFGEDPRLVARLGVAAVRAMQASGVLAGIKHFPGHGDTSVDSHLSLPTVSHSRAHMDAVELPPFQAAIRAGAGAVLTSHIIYLALDPQWPATVSPAVVRLLREDLGFAGLVITDSMAMQAITHLLPPGEAAVRAVLAGADIILACGTVEAQREALEAVRRAAADGRISAERIAASVERIGEAKRRLGLPARAIVSEDDVDARVGIGVHLKVAEHVAEAAVTLVRDRANILPLPAVPIGVIAVDGQTDTATRFVQSLRAAGRHAELVSADSVSAGGTAAAFAVVLDAPWTAVPAEARARTDHVIQAAASRGPTIIVGAGSPYGLAGLPDSAACVAVYGTDTPSLGAAARVLAGTIRPRGRLPVSIGEPGQSASQPFSQR
jgi:beta-N-acetylhexosaminidase